MKKLLFVALLFACSITLAQTTVRIAADSSSGTYAKMLGEIVSACSELDVQPVIGNPPGSMGGAPGNLDALVNNKADAAFMHSDVYIFNAQADPSYNKFKTLIALYPEPVHVIALRQSKTSKNGASGYLGSKQEFNSLSDAVGYSVGAAGGGVITAKVLSGSGGGNFNVVDEGTGKAVFQALDNGQIAMAIFVGAQPLPNFEGINKQNYKLLPIGDTIASRVSNYYRQVNINYPGMTNGPLRTIAPISTLLTRQFTTGPKLEMQKKLRNCFTQHLADLQDNGSPNWQDVVPNDHGIAMIQWLDLPADTKPVQTKRK